MSEAYLSKNDLESLRENLVSASTVDLSKTETQQLNRMTTYLLEEWTLCRGQRRIHFYDEELELINSLVEYQTNITDVADLREFETKVKNQ